MTCAACTIPPSITLEPELICFPRSSEGAKVGDINEAFGFTPFAELETRL